MDTKFYIIPSTKTYYEEMTAESKEEALIDFASTMADDMSAYFDATDEKPVAYPHEYKYPEGNFQLAMSIFVATTTGNKESVYYSDNLDSDIKNAYLRHIGAIGKLQEAYDAIIDSLYKGNNEDVLKICKTGKKFHKVLRMLTGCE